MDASEKMDDGRRNAEPAWTEIGVHPHHSAGNTARGSGGNSGTGVPPVNHADERATTELAHYRGTLDKIDPTQMTVLG